MKRTIKDGALVYRVTWRLEPILWTSLSAWFSYRSSFTVSSIITLIGSVWNLVWCLERDKEQKDSSLLWRHGHSAISCDPQGRSMAVALVPLLIMSVMSTARSNDPTWSHFANITCLAYLFNTSVPMGALITLVVVTAFDSSLWCFESLWMCSLWLVVDWRIHVSARFHQVLTRGEWWVILGLIVVSITYFSRRILEQHAEVLPLYAVVSFMGLLGCGVASAVASPLAARSSQRIPTALVRVLVLVGIPFAAIEGSLLWLDYEGDLRFLPKCLSWLVSFLSQHETLAYPRGTWLLYWGAVLIVTIPLSPKVERCYGSVVVARKWFHFVAFVLFAPVTLLAPQLMSLAYAVALALLILVENIRNDLLPECVQDFYSAYLDTGKDMDNRDKIVVTHMALIAGCALPLWISQVVVGYSGRLLPLWGTICLGLGDSMGAIVGTFFGKTPWHPRNKRTLEGSLAAWITMAVTCHLITSGSGQNEPWFAAVSFVTLLEASTQQIDNLVLPLAGTVVILMQEG